MGRGRRYDENPKLNMKKVAATVIAIIVFIMIIISLKKILTTEKKEKEFIKAKAYFSVYEDGKWGIIDSNGSKIENVFNDEMIIVPNKNEDVFVCTYDVDYDNESYKTKIYNSKGMEIFSGYGNVEPLENMTDNKTWYDENVLKFISNGKVGLIDFKGKEILKAEYDKIYSLQGTENCLILELDGKKGLFNSTMKEIIIEPEYTEINTLQNNYQNGFIVKNEEGKVGLIGSDKSKILTCQYEEIKGVTGNNYYVIVEKGKQKIINSYGKVILDTGFDSVEQIELDEFVVTKNGKYGVVDKEGKVVIDFQYDYLKFSISDYFIAKKENKYGIIKNDNSVIVNFDYEFINYIKEADFFKAENQDFTTDIIDRNFNVVLDNIIISELNLDDGYIRARVNGTYSYYNFKFEEKENKDILLDNTLFLVNENGKYGYENKEGKRIVDCIYDDAKEQNEYGYCVVNKDGVWGVLKADGTVIVKPSIDLSNNIYIDFIGNYYRFDDTNLEIYTK